MKKIKVGALFLCFVIMLNSACFSIEVEDVATETNEVTTMTLDEAISYALKNNAGVVDINKTVKDQEDTYKDAKKAYRTWQYDLKDGGYSYEEYYDYLTAHGHYLEMAEYAYNGFLAQKVGTEEIVKYSVKNMAFSIDELEKSFELLEKTVAKQEMDVKIAEVKCMLNMITSFDVETAKQTLTSTKLQLESLKSTLNVLQANLKSLMGFDVTKELEITIPESELTILEVENLAEVIENSLETNSDAISAKVAYKQKEMQYILATETHFLDREGIRDAKKDFSDADMRLNNSLNVIKENLYALYKEVKTNEESTILSKSEYEQLQIKYIQMKVMHELGMITTHDFNSYEIALLNAKNTYESSLHKNILLNDRWNIALKVGDILAKEEQ